MSDDDQDSTPEEPDFSSSPTRVGEPQRPSKVMTVLVWLARRGWMLVVAAIVGAVAIAAIVGIEIPRWLRIVGLFGLLSAPTFGRWLGGRVNELAGDEQLVWIVDVDLLDRDGAGVYNCPTPRWSEWDVTDGDLWWATPNLAFAKNVDLEEQTLEGTWPGTLPEPVLMRALIYLRYNRERLLDSAKKGEVYDLNGWSMLREATIAATKRVVRTFEEGTLPDDGKSFREEVDRALEQFDLDQGDLDDDPTEWSPGDDEPAPDFLQESPFPNQEVPADDD
jgi:hypothetical protein